MGITDPYSMDFREPVWPEGLKVEYYPSTQSADWLMLYKTWFDGEWWAACRRVAGESIRCDLLENASALQRLVDARR
jgi:hypothetical protein